jgi:hypothetical protein
MRISSIFFTLCVFGFAPHILANDTSKYEPLKDFCIETKKDTQENCECGQATADKIMSPEEQAIALALMLGNSDALSKLGDKHDEFMNKLSQVTNGCS